MKVTAKPQQKTATITMKTREQKDNLQVAAWWKAKSKADLCGQLLGTAAYLKENQAYRYRQAAIYARL